MQQKSEDGVVESTYRRLRRRRGDIFGFQSMGAAVLEDVANYSVDFFKSGRI